MTDFFHLVGDEQVAFVVQNPGYLFYDIFLIGGKNNHRTFHSQAFKDIT